MSFPRLIATVENTNTISKDLLAEIRESNAHQRRLTQTLKISNIVNILTLVASMAVIIIVLLK